MGKKEIDLLKGKRKWRIVKRKFCEEQKEILKSYNIGKSWFSCQEEAWNSENSEENSSRRKIVIPEEDIDYDNNEYYSEDEITDENGVFKKIIHHLIIDISLLERENK